MTGKACYKTLGGRHRKPPGSFALRRPIGLVTSASDGTVSPSARDLRTGRSQSFAGQLAGLLHPTNELSFVELLILADVEVAHFLVLGLAGGKRA